MKKLPALLIGLLLVVASAGACGEDATSVRASDCPSPTDVPQPDPPFEAGRALMNGESGATLIDVEIAETPEQRAQGLMHRTCLPDEAGMIFVFFEETTSGFYMKNTLIPLSIAFFDVEGDILRIMDMEPCEADPCEIYNPEVPYMGALEVNQGAFERWDITEGDNIRITQNDRNKH